MRTEAERVWARASEDFSAEVDDLNAVIMWDNYFAAKRLFEADRYFAKACRAFRGDPTDEGRHAVSQAAARLAELRTRYNVVTQNPDTAETDGVKPEPSGTMA